MTKKAPRRWIERILEEAAKPQAALPWQSRRQQPVQIEPRVAASA